MPLQQCSPRCCSRSVKPWFDRSPAKTTSTEPNSAKAATSRHDHFSRAFAIRMMDATCQPFASQTYIWPIRNCCVAMAGLEGRA